MIVDNKEFIDSIFQSDFKNLNINKVNELSKEYLTVLKNEMKRLRDGDINYLEYEHKYYLEYTYNLRTKLDSHKKNFFDYLFNYSVVKEINNTANEIKELHEQTFKQFFYNLNKHYTNWNKSIESKNILIDVIFDENNRQKTREQESDFNRYFSKFKQAINFSDLLLKNVEKEFYAKVLESSSYRNKDMEGYNHTLSIQSYIDDLTEFRHLIKNQKSGSIIDCMIANLEQAYEIAACIHYDICPRVALKLSMILSDIHQKIQSGELTNFVLPGGTRGHAVMLEFSKQDSQSWKLSIINTGEGAKLFSNLFEGFLWVLGLFHRIKVQNIEYHNIQKEEMTVDFLFNLVYCYQFSSMKQVEELIEANCHHFEKGTGQIHKAQNKGNCTFKSVSAYIHEQLGDNHKDFKLLVTERQITQLNEYYHKNQANHINDFLQSGQLILQKRKLKAKE
jgi:hypothetical protein